MIPVTAQGEPKQFNRRVRQPGLAWLRTNNIPLNRRLPPKTPLPPYWRRCLDDLHTSYGGICGYLCVFVERCTGGISVDHLVPKSRRAGLAYEWSNYRLACMAMNAKKCDYQSVLDPFSLTPETFHLELVTGRIFPNPSHSKADRSAAQTTIDRLRLDGPEPRRMRVRHFQEYLDGDVSQDRLRRHSPFVWYEANRQGLL